MKFVDKQLAIKLKEKGFDKPCFGWYDGKLDIDKLHLNVASKNNCTYKDLLDYAKDIDDIIDAPTTDQVLEWLREDCGLHIAMVCSRDFDIDADGRELGSWVYWWYEIYAHLSANLIYQEEEKEYETYDEAILDAIEYVVNNLI